MFVQPLCPLSKLLTAPHQIVEYDNTLVAPGLRVIDKTERKYEKWLKRLAKAQGTIYVPSDTKEENRIGWKKAVEWFEIDYGDNKS